MSASYTERIAAAIEHCESMSAFHPSLASEYANISSLFSRKLWHQLTASVLSFVSSPVATAPDGTNSHLALYDRVVLACETKLNPLSLSRIASGVASSLVDSGDAMAGKAILENLLEKKSQLVPTAELYLEGKLALLNLNQMQVTGVLDSVVLNEIKGKLKKGMGVLQELSGTEDASIVHSAFYEASMLYRKAVGPPEAFYREALLFLNYTPMASLSKEVKYNLATDISLAALTGDGVFGFGEVVTHSILESLDGTENMWLLELMKVFANGDVVKFHKVTTEFAEKIEQQPALVSRKDVVKEKITLLALVDMVFERPSAERTLEFHDIGTRVGVDLDKVEWVIMRALSLGLIKGSMDQVDQTLTVSWVMPRVLDTAQLKALSNRFGEWAVKVSKVRDYMGEQVPTLVAPS